MKLQIKKLLQAKSKSRSRNHNIASSNLKRAARQFRHSRAFTDIEKKKLNWKPLSAMDDKETSRSRSRSRDRRSNHESEEGHVESDRRASRDNRNESSTKSGPIDGGNNLYITNLSFQVRLNFLAALLSFTKFSTTSGSFQQWHQKKTKPEQISNYDKISTDNRGIFAGIF